MTSWYSRPAAREWRCPATDPAVTAFHAALPGYRPTPLVEIPGLARELGVGRVFVKDESARFGLPAFKVLGASWAVERVLAGREDVTTLVTATDGNHGRAVARVAAWRGLSARVFVPRGVPESSVSAIRGEGAEVVRLDCSYDDAVSAAAGSATAGAVLVQDTAWPGYEQVPAWIVDGYRTLCAEIDEQLAGTRADLVAVPMGVGSLAQAVVTHYRGSGRRHAPAVLGVEPETAACVLASLTAGRPTAVATQTTVMNGLNCGTVSSLAWPVLHAGLDASVAVTDEQAVHATAHLAAAGVGSGPSGAASYAGAVAALTGPGAGERRAELGLGPGSTLVLLSTEGRAGCAG